MLAYTSLKDRPREFLAATGLTHEEFARLLPAFAGAYRVLYPPDKTWEGKVRHRQVGGGAKGVLPEMEDQLLFILVYQKTRVLPIQAASGSCKSLVCLASLFLLYFFGATPCSASESKLLVCKSR
jgi:hypothetical protein